MLTRHAIDSGMYQRQFRASPELWTEEQIAASLDATLRARPVDVADVWIFAYGSLMWNPMIEFKRREVATLDGWHRSFCLAMSAGRASPDRPGRMLGLRPGGSTQGVVFQLPPDGLHDELRRIWIREMVLGFYRPIWARVRLADGSLVPAVVFVAEEKRAHFRGDASAEAVAPLIEGASGELGSNADYVFRLQVALLVCGLSDPYIDAIASRINREGDPRMIIHGAPRELAAGQLI
ncbi:gamma-glutamylcyclotransferase [Paraburkholderia guartelaensis]|uniref:gamma-glutamylcyclotransferase n=1 Tax=Paraburkholderia guartelaensis TaxID=2546446 RepID=UPI002AB6FD86|nr:gamma-glutamylcyclotransferase [Paraburkholderia guartelaensis]